MSRFNSLVVCAIFAMFAAFHLAADTTTVNGVTWTYTISNGEASLGLGDTSNPAVPKSTTGALTIPSTLGDCPVTRIGRHAFQYCSGLTSVTIPDSVTIIGINAFYGCSGLSSVTIPDSVTNIWSQAFFNCSRLASATIGNGVTSIGSSAFYNCTNLTSVTMGNNVTSIGVCTFGGCISLTSVTIPDSVTNIWDSAFHGCSGLTSVAIGDSVTSIGDKAFYGCSGLTSVAIGDSVTSIGDNAFYGCSGLTSVAIPDSVTSLSTTTFEGCGKLWAAWYRTLANSSAAGGVIPGGGSASVVTTVVQQVEAPYALSSAVADRAIASVAVSGDCSIGSFVLKDGKVFDTMMYVSNTADHEVSLSLPSGYSYKTIKGATPLTIPASSQCIISITRVDANTFLVMREELDDVQ